MISIEGFDSLLPVPQSEPRNHQTKTLVMGKVKVKINLQSGDAIAMRGNGS